MEENSLNTLVGQADVHSAPAAVRAIVTLCSMPSSPQVGSSQIGGQSQNRKIYSIMILADQPDQCFPYSESVVLSRSQLSCRKVGW